MDREAFFKILDVFKDLLLSNFVIFWLFHIYEVTNEN